VCFGFGIPAQEKESRMDYYEFVRGPFAIFTFGVLICGVLYRLLHWLWVGKRVNMLYPGESITGTIRSIVHHIVPFGAGYMRKRPIFTIVTFLFHLSAIILPLFFLAHIILWFESFNILWRSIPNAVADVMTIIVLLACLFFIGRRLLIKEARQVSSITDYLLPGLIFASFLFGFLAYHQWGPYRPMLISHIFISEILIMIIPFSKLMHMLIFPFSRAYMGAEYNRVMGSSDW